MNSDKKKNYLKPHSEAIVFTLRDTLMWMPQSEMGGTQMSEKKESWQSPEWGTEETDSEE